MALTDTDGVVVVRFLCDGLPDNALRVVSLDLREAVSRWPEARVRMDAAQGDLDAALLLGRGAEIVCERSDGTFLRRFRGIVIEAEQDLTPTAARQALSVVLSSPASLLALTSDRRVFTELSATDVAKILLQDIGLASDAIVLRCAAAPAVRPSITLVGESLRAALERLLEEEGLCFFTVEADAGPRFVIGNTKSAWEPTEATFRYNPQGASLFEIAEIVATSTFTPTSAVLLDHDPLKPSLDVTGKADGPFTSAAVVEDWPSGARTPAAADALARRRIAGLRARAQTVEITGSAPQIAAGHLFTVSEAPEPLSEEYVAISVRHAFERQGEFRTFVRAVPSRVDWVAERRAARPRMPGPTTAWIAGPDKAVVHTEEHGRSRIRFPWDRRALGTGDTSSAWARVSSPHASSSQVVPRVGWAVLVDFENGDPDRPVVLGRLFDGWQPPPHPLPAQRHVSTLLSADIDKGADFHELRTDDSKDAELLHFHAAKDYVLDVGKDRTEAVVAAESWQIKVDRRVKIEENETRTREKNLQQSIGGSLARTVEKDWATTVKGDVRFTVVGDRTVTIDDDVSLKTTGDDSLTTTGSFTLDLGSLAETSTRFDLAIGKTSSLVVDGDIDEHADGGIFETVKTSYTIKALQSALTVKGNAVIAAKGAVKIQTTAALTVSAGKEIELSSKDAITLHGAAVTLQGAKAFTLKVGSNKLTIAKGGFSMSGSKIKIEGSGPVIVGVGLVGSK